MYFFIVSVFRPVLIAFTVLFFFMPWAEVYAGGQKEDRLPEARRLIDEGKYNDAILVLTDIMKKNPDEFDNAQKLIREIKDAREKYNELYAQLIKVLDPPKGEAIDEDLAYSLIRQMEALDKTPNKAAVAAFAQARDTIVFAVTNRTFQNIMDECWNLLAEGKYIEAIDKYLSGFTLHREFFVKKDYGNIILDQIDSDTADIKEYVGQFKTLLPLLNNQTAVVVKAVENKSLDDIESSVSDYSELLLNVLSLKRKIVYKAMQIDAIRTAIQKEDESDIPYLSTLRVLSKGRVKSPLPEGIAGAVERYWMKTLNSAVPGITALLSGAYDDSLAAYDSASYQRSMEDSAIVRRYADLLLPLLDMQGGLVELDENGNPTVKGQKLISEHLPQVLKIKEMNRETEFLDRMSRQRMEIAALNVYVDNSSDPDGIGKRREKLLDLRRGIKEDKLGIGEIRKSLAGVKGAGIDTSGAETVTDTVLKRLDGFIRDTYDTEIRYADKIAGLKIDRLEKVVKTGESDIDQASSMIAGVKEKINSIEYVVKRPDKAEEIIKKTEKSLNDAEKELSSVLESINGYDKQVRDSEPLKLQVKRIEDLKTRIGKMRVSMKSLSVKAAELNNKADDMYNLGSLRLDEAYARYDRGNYDAARSKYFEAETALQKSLEYREDPKVRKLLTEEMPAFFDKIMVALNRQIIREVRTLINRGKDYYNVEKFIKAEQTFQQARERYKVTHTEPNPEIESWLVKVKKALEATSGRVIAPTDPLYPEMIHILNIAEEDFEKGKELLKQNKKDEAKALFDEAVKNIEYVKETFPRNFKASVLYLRILEFTEKDTFDSYFKSMFESAVAKIKTDPKTADDDLLALYEVKPDYPGIKRALYRSGVAAGRIIPPPAKVDIAKARELYRKAKKIADSDNRAQFPIAIAYLEESLQIDSNFNSAAVLLDQLRTSTGGISVSVMSDKDLQKLRFAENLYIEGKYLEASIIINQLWSVPRNRKSAKLNDLKKKVEARLR